VNSTSVAEGLGDPGWKVLIEPHHRIVRRELKHYQGREIDTAGDGFFAAFNAPASAISCACPIADAVREVGIEIGASVHFRECKPTMPSGGHAACTPEPQPRARPTAR
jgi:class 3 adenylate cyclase